MNREVLEIVTWEKWKTKYKVLTKYFWSVLIIFILLFDYHPKCNYEQTKEKDYDTVLDDAIRKFEGEYNYKIYPYGRECLWREGKKRGLITEKELYGLIVENYKILEKK